MISLTSDSSITLMSSAMLTMPSAISASRRHRPQSRVSCPEAVIAFPRIQISVIKILSDNRFPLSTVREAAPYTNTRHAIEGYNAAENKRESGAGNYACDWTRIGTHV